MRTVKELKAELDKFDDDYLCEGCDGSGHGEGIIIQRPNRAVLDDDGYIYCGSDAGVEEKATEFIKVRG